MKNINICEIKKAWLVLYNTDCNKLWQKLNIELAKRLPKDDYLQFIEKNKNYMGDFKMCYDIFDMTTDDIKDIIEDLVGLGIDKDTDVYFILLLDELQKRLPESEFTTFCELY
jgi:hypothetical protein